MDVPTAAVGNFMDDDMYTPYLERVETYVVPVLFSIIFIVGILGNGTLILIFTRNKVMRNVPNTFILNLALADLLVLLTCVPFASTTYTFESWPFGEFICKLSETTKDTSIGVSGFTLIALIVERYCATVRHRISTKPSTAVAAIAIIWVLSVIMALPTAVFSHVQVGHVLNGTIHFCSPFPPKVGRTYEKSITLFKFVTYYAVPLCVIGFFYALMARRSFIRAENIPGEQDGQAGQVKDEKTLAKLVLSLVTIFIICFFPYYTFMLWFHFYPDAEEIYNEFWHFYRIVGFCFSFLNSCFNPIALYCISDAFRRLYNRYLFTLCSKKLAIGTI